MVVIGGLLTSTFLTLLVVPVVYELLGGWQERRAAKRVEREARENVSPVAASPAE